MVKKPLNARKFRSKKKDYDSCFALNAAQNAAIQEVNAEIRDIRKAQADEEFHTKIKNDVAKRVKHDKAKAKAHALAHAGILKEVIVTTVKNFYKQPVKNNRD